MSHFPRSWTRSSLLACAAATALSSGILNPVAAYAAENDPQETIVVTDTRFNTDIAPAKASLETTEPQTIINRSYIQNFISPTADYVTILAIVPGMTGGDSNGPGLSDGGAKNTLRGLPDGDFAMQYDDIPFGDTNGPTHHNISYFPASTLGSVVVDRGPGNAGNLGAATYGGTVKLFSETLGATPTASAAASYGSFNTFVANANAQTGDLDFLGTTRVLVNLQDLQSDGALTSQDLRTENALMKIETKITPNWTLTAFGDYSFLKEHLSDNNGSTPAQIAAYGKNFSLQTTDPTLPTYYAYNWTSKQTDFEYFRVRGTIVGDLKLDNTTYTYSYWNHTFSPNSQTQTLGQINSDTSSDNGTQTLLNGTKLTNNLLAYSKQNAYRVNGDVVRLTEDYNVGPVSGEVRAGSWFEYSFTHRFKYYFDSNLCNTDLVSPFQGAGNEGSSEAAAAAVCGVKKGSALNGALGYAKDDEYSHWVQYEPFMEVDIKPLPNLVITPGVKYIHWLHSADAPVEQGSTCGVDLACEPYNNLGQNFRASFVTTKTLPFLQANYKITSNWSTYFEYAKGIYVPDISAFENSPPTAVYPQPETTTNYQFGTVYYADSFTFDADVYYIPINNNYVSVLCSYSNQETCYVNNGAATYKGVEAEGTYAFDNVMGVDLTGLALFANGALMSSKVTSGANNGKWEPNAPRWTVAAGLLYKQNGITLSLIDKLISSEYNDVTNIPVYKMPSYGDLSASAGYQVANYEIRLSLDNLLNSRQPIAISEGGTGTSLLTSTDQYQFQAPMSFMVTLRGKF